MTSALKILFLPFNHQVRHEKYHYPIPIPCILLIIIIHNKFGNKLLTTDPYFITNQHWYLEWPTSLKEQKMMVKLCACFSLLGATTECFPSGSQTWQWKIRPLSMIFLLKPSFRGNGPWPRLITRGSTTSGLWLFRIATMWGPQDS